MKILNEKDGEIQRVKLQEKWLTEEEKSKLKEMRNIEIRE